MARCLSDDLDKMNQCELHILVGVVFLFVQVNDPEISFAGHISHMAKIKEITRLHTEPPLLA